MRDTVEICGPQPWQLTGRHVLLMFIAFFGVVFAVNGLFLVRALSTYSGVVAAEPYRKGLAYNERIAAGERQAALGWNDDLALGFDGTLSVTMADAGGAPISGLHLTGVISRPSTAAADVALRLAERSPGHYSAPSTATAPGAWLAAIEARHQPGDAEPVYRARRRLWLKP